MGLLDQVAIVQEEYRDLLRTPVGAGGPTLDEQVIQNGQKDYSEDAIVNMAIAMEYGTELGMQSDQKQRLRDAFAVLDHLSTLGMEVTFKKTGNGESKADH